MIRILIVDDELIVRIGIRSMLDWGKHGFEIVGEAADGAEALALAPRAAAVRFATGRAAPRSNTRP